MVFWSHCPLTAFVFILTWFGQSIAHGNLVPRSDLKDFFQSSLCDRSSTKINLKRRAWTRGLFEASIQISTLEINKNKTVSYRNLARYARWFMHKNVHRSLSFGRCSKNRAWVASSPLPRPLVFHGKRFWIPKNIQSVCKNFYIRYAYVSGGSSLLVAAQGNSSIDTLKFNPGMLSLSCVPNSPKWAGPELWALVPVGGVSFPSLPDYSALALVEDKSIDEKSAALGAWINMRREEEGIPAINFSLEPLKAAASKLTAKDHLFHNRKLMDRVSRNFDDIPYTLLGENRVQGGSLTEMAWLLWFSPSHRDLLLSNQAQVGSVKTKESNGSMHGVVVTGRSTFSR